MKKSIIALAGLGIIIGGFSLTSFADEQETDNLDKFRVQNLDMLNSNNDTREYSQEEMIQYCIENFDLSPEEADNMMNFMNRPGGCH